MTNYVQTVRNTIVRNEAIIDVEGLGNVHFTRPCMYHMGGRAWHVEAWFNVEGRDYWCTVWNDGETELQTRAKPSRAWFNAPIRRLPETAKRAWREAIAKAGKALIREAKQLRCAFIDAGDSDNAERVAMGNEAKGAVDTLPPLFDESVSNDVPRSPSTAGRETAQPNWNCSTQVGVFERGALVDLIDAPAPSYRAVDYVRYHWPQYDKPAFTMAIGAIRDLTPAQALIAEQAAKDATP